MTCDRSPQLARGIASGRLRCGVTRACRGLPRNVTAHMVIPKNEPTGCRSDPDTDRCRGSALPGVGGTGRIAFDGVEVRRAMFETSVQTQFSLEIRGVR